MSPSQRLYEYEVKKTKLLDGFKKLNGEAGETISLRKNTSNLFRHRKQGKGKVDVRSFNRVISVDPENLVAEVEGMTTYEDFVNECLKYSCLPTVVPELKSITVGGALAGVAIESSSFRFGLVHETILSFEALLGDGRIVTCSPENAYRDLFFAFPNSYGTLGYALKIKVKLIPAGKYVRLRHYRFTDASRYFEELKNWCLANRSEGTINYIDGVVFDKGHFYITTGEFVNTVPYVSNYKYMNIYYQSLQKQEEDYLTALDYIWRWDPDWFWCSKFFFMQNPAMRFLFGKFLLKSTRFWKIRRFVTRNWLARNIYNLFQKKTESVIQDVEIPIQRAAEFLTFFEQNIGIKPVWVCPTMPYSQDRKFTFYNMSPRTLYVNFGFWDMVPSDKDEGYYNRLVEDKVQELGGNKGLYSNVYYTEKAFWEIYDKGVYQGLKGKYDPGAKLGDLYQKCGEKM